MLNLILGTIARRILPNETQNKIGFLLFWAIGMPLVVMLIGGIAWVLWMATTGQRV